MESTDQQRGIILKEYGRNIQKIVDHLRKIDDREKRTRFAYTLIELMKQINPNIRDGQENAQKIWDHLYIMSDFDLDVDTEYPMPEKSILGKKPMRVEYNTHNLQFKHYGRNIELLIQKAIDTENPEDREAAIIYVGRLMKRFYAAWNKENIEDEMIVNHLKDMSGGRLIIDSERVKREGLFDSNVKEKDFSRMQGGNNGNFSNNSGNNGGNYKRSKKNQQQYRRKN